MIDFSVIVPTYNNDQKIERAINSIIKQTFSNWELIIVDDGSTDSTEEKIKPFLGDKRIDYIKQQNQGVTVARNTGVEKATGEFICFLDSDDEVSKEWLKDFNSLRDVKTGYISCGYFLKGKERAPKLNKDISAFKYSSLAGCFALKKDVFESIGGYDLNLKQSENWEMTARALEFCAKNNLKVVHTDSANFIYHHEKTAEETRQRDEYRAKATLYLHQKYSEGGVLHFRKDDFLLSSAINFTRAGNLKKSREVFRQIVKKQPTLRNLIRMVIFEIPPLRKKKWMR